MKYERVNDSSSYLGRFPPGNLLFQPLFFFRQEAIIQAHQKPVLRFMTISCNPDI